MFDRRRYMLFAGSLRRPLGGWLNFVDSYESLEQALKIGEGLLGSKRDPTRWYHVVDRKTLKVVARGGLPGTGIPRIDV